MIKLEEKNILFGSLRSDFHGIDKTYYEINRNIQYFLSRIGNEFRKYNDKYSTITYHNDKLLKSGIALYLAKIEELSLQKAILSLKYKK